MDDSDIDVVSNRRKLVKPINNEEEEETQHGKNFDLPLYGDDDKPKNNSYTTNSIFLKLIFFMVSTFSSRKTALEFFKKIYCQTADFIHKLVYIVANLPKYITDLKKHFLSPKFYDEEQIYGEEFSKYLDNIWIWCNDNKSNKSTYTFISSLIFTLSKIINLILFLITTVRDLIEHIRFKIFGKKLVDGDLLRNVEKSNSIEKEKSNSIENSPFTKIIGILNGIKIPIIDDIFTKICRFVISILMFLVKISLRVFGVPINYIFSRSSITLLFSSNTEEGRSFFSQRISRIVWAIKSNVDLIIFLIIIGLVIYFGMNYYRIEYMSDYIGSTKEKFSQKVHGENLLDNKINDMYDDVNDDVVEDYFSRQHNVINSGESYENGNTKICNDKVIRNIKLLELDNGLCINISNISISYPKILDTCFVMCAHFDNDISYENGVSDPSKNKMTIIDIYKNDNIDKLRFDDNSKKGIVSNIISYASLSFGSIFQQDVTNKNSEAQKISKGKELFEYMTRGNEKQRSEPSFNDGNNIAGVVNTNFNTDDTFKFDVLKCDIKVSILSSQDDLNINFEDFLIMNRNIIRLNLILCDYNADEIIDIYQDFKSLSVLLKNLSSKCILDQYFNDIITSKSCNKCNSLHSTHRFIFSGKFSKLEEWTLVTMAYGNTITYFDSHNIVKPVGLTDIVSFIMSYSTIQNGLVYNQGNETIHYCNVETFKISELLNIYFVENDVNQNGFCRDQNGYKTPNLFFYQIDRDSRLVNYDEKLESDDKNDYHLGFGSKVKIKRELKSHKLDIGVDDLITASSNYELFCRHNIDMSKKDVQNSMQIKSLQYFAKYSNKVNEITKYYMETFKNSRKRIMSNFIFFDSRFKSQPRPDDIKQIVDSKKLENVNFYDTYSISICDHYKLNSFVGVFLKFYTDSDVYNEQSIWNPFMGLNDQLGFNHTLEIIEDYYSKMEKSKSDMKSTNSHDEMNKNTNTDYVSMFKKVSKVGSVFMENSFSLLNSFVSSLPTNYKIQSLLSNDYENENVFMSQMEIERPFFLRNLVSRKIVSKADISSDFDNQSNGEKSANPLLEILFLKGIHNDPIDNIGALYKLNQDFFANYIKKINEEWLVFITYLSKIDSRRRLFYEEDEIINMCLCSHHNFIPSDIVNIGIVNVNELSKNINIDSINIKNMTKPRILKRKSKLFDTNLLNMYKKMSSGGENSKTIKRKDGLPLDKIVNIHTEPILFADELYSIQNLVHSIGNEWKKILNILLMIPESPLKFPTIYEASISNTFILDYIEKELFSESSNLKKQCSHFDNSEDFKRQKSDFYIDLVELFRVSNFEFSSVIEKYVNTSNSNDRGTKYKKSIFKSNDFFTNLCVDYCNGIGGIINDLSYLEIISDFIKIKNIDQNQHDKPKLIYHCDFGNREKCDYMWRSVANK